MSAFVAASALVVASVAAFTLSELADFAVYAPLARKGARITIDTPDDLAFVEAVHARMSAKAGEASLAESLAWLPELRRHPWPVYLAVQDGLETLGPERFAGFDGIFIGGTLPWKLRTAPHWAALGHRLGMPVHFGRCGTARRVSYARALGCASIDSSLPLWSRANMSVFTKALDQLHLLSEFDTDARLAAE